MTYCIQQDLLDRIGEDKLIQLTDKERLGEMNTEVLNRALQDADGQIDSYVGARYSLPINPISKTLVRIACFLTIYYLHDKQRTEQVREDYDDSIKALAGISKGTIDIGIDVTGAKPATTGSVEFENGSNVFDRKDNGFI